MNLFTTSDTARAGGLLLRVSLRHLSSLCIDQAVFKRIAEVQESFHGVVSPNSAGAGRKQWLGELSHCGEVSTVSSM